MGPLHQIWANSIFWPDKMDTLRESLGGGDADKVEYFVQCVIDLDWEKCIIDQVPLFHVYARTTLIIAMSRAPLMRVLAWFWTILALDAAHGALVVLDLAEKVQLGEGAVPLGVEVVTKVNWLGIVRQQVANVATGEVTYKATWAQILGAIGLIWRVEAVCLFQQSRLTRAINVEIGLDREWGDSS